MEDNKKNKKNHWTQTKVNEATKKINQEIYKRNRQASINIKIDDMSIYINDRITRRGIAKGLISIQEDLNKNLLLIEKYTMATLLEKDPRKQYDLLEKAQKIIKIEIWSDIRFLMINKAITPGEITELIRRQLSIDEDLEKWMSSISNAISAKW